MDRSYRPLQVGGNPMGQVGANPFGSLQPAPIMTMADGRQLTYQQALQMMALQEQKKQSQVQPLGEGLFGGGVTNSLIGETSSVAPELSSTAYTSLPGISTQAPEVIASTMPGAAPVTTASSVGTGAPLGAGSLAANAAAMGPLPLAAIAGATYLGGKSAYDMFKGKKDNSVPGMIGRASLGIATGGLSEVGKALGLWGRQSTKDYQKEQNDKLGKKIPSFKAFMNTVEANRATAPQSKFNQTGNVADLGVDDITGANPFFEKYGDKWLGGMSEAERNAEAKRALDAGAVGSKKGLITVDWNKLNQPAPQLASSVQAMTKPAAIPKVVKK